MAPSTVAAAAMASLARQATMTTQRSSMGLALAARRGYANLSRSAVRRLFADQGRKAQGFVTEEQSMSAMEKAASREVFQDAGAPLFPGTFVALPMSKLPNHPRVLLRYHWWRLRSWLQCQLSLLSVKVQSMPGWRARPRFRARRSQIVPTATAMYAEVLSALAAGDRGAVSALCTRSFAKTLHAAIDRRPAREAVRFEVVRATRRPFYPRLASHLIHPVNPHDKTVLTEQAVVALSSVQQLSRHDAATGATLPGSLRLQDKIEYVVLARDTSTRDYVPGPWRVWGTVRGTSVEGYLEEMEVIEKEERHRSGYRPREQKK